MAGIFLAGSWYSFPDIQDPNSRVKYRTYKSILDKVRALNSRKCLAEIIKSFPSVPVKTLDNIVYQIYQKDMEVNLEKCKRQRKERGYYEAYMKAVKTSKLGVMLEMADKEYISPALFARIILTEHYKRQNLNLIREEFVEKIQSDLRLTKNIKDGRLAAEIHLCQIDDRYYGPTSDAIRRSVGAEYEAAMKHKLTELDIPFYREQNLRFKGSDKTPDIVLKVPILVGWKLVNWIECKASFGDNVRHKEYLKSQYRDYRDRFGPGLIVYKYGYIDELRYYKRNFLTISHGIPTQMSLLDFDNDFDQKFGIGNSNEPAQEISIRRVKK